MDSEDRTLLARLDERTERMLKILEGNGQPGLTQRVDSLEASRDTYRGAEAQRKKYMQLIAWLASLSGLGTLVTLFKHFVLGK